MKQKFLELSFKMQNMIMSEDGQDLIEYALVVALIAFGATAGITAIGTKLGTLYTNINTAIPV